MSTGPIFYKAICCGIRIRVIPQSSKLKLGVRVPYTATIRQLDYASSLLPKGPLVCIQLQRNRCKPTESLYCGVSTFHCLCYTPHSSYPHGCLANQPREFVQLRFSCGSAAAINVCSLVNKQKDRYH